MRLTVCFVTVWLLFAQHSIHSYRTDIDEGGEAAFCQYRKHLTFKPSATCCANQVVNPALEIEKNWGACVPKNGPNGDTVEDLGWEIYSCLLKKANGENDQFTLKEYAELITKNYPDDIKSSIITEIEAQSVPATSVTDYARFEKLRVTYYDIEKWVCENKTSEKEFGKIEMCSSWKEESHRAGMCCKKSYPVDIRYKSLFDAGDPETKDKCQKQMHDGLKKLNATDMIEHSLMEICDVACAMHVNPTMKFDMADAVLNNRDYWYFNVTEELGKFPFIIPQFLPTKTKQILANNITLASTYHINSTMENIHTYTFADLVGGDSFTERPNHHIAWVHRGNKTIGENYTYEFMGRRFHKGIIHVAVLCSAYKEIVSLMEYFVFSECKPEDVIEETPLPIEPVEPEKPAATESPSEPESVATDPPAEDEPSTTAPVAAE